MDAKSCPVLGTILSSFGTRALAVVCERFICCLRTNGQRFSNREHYQTIASEALSSARRPRLGVGWVGWSTIGQTPSPAAPLSKLSARSQAWKCLGGANDCKVSKSANSLVFKALTAGADFLIFSEQSLNGRNHASLSLSILFLRFRQVTLSTINPSQPHLE